MRLLTSYSQYHNRKYRKTGHLLQGRYKSILCESDQYFAELVRYIHLNPVRARMVNSPEDFPYSSHRAYVGLEVPWLVDVESVLRHFGATKKLARERFNLFVRAGIKEGHKQEFYNAEQGRILGSAEFVEKTIRRIGEIPREEPKFRVGESFEPELLLSTFEEVTGSDRSEFCVPSKQRDVVLVKELLIMLGRKLGASNAALARMTGLDASVVSRRYESAKAKIADSDLIETRMLLERLRDRLSRKP